MKACLATIYSINVVLLFDTEKCYVFWLYNHGGVILDLLEVENNTLIFKESISKGGEIWQSSVEGITNIYHQARREEILTFAPAALLTHPNKELREMIKLYFD